MARSIKKGPFCDDHLMKKVEAQKDNNEKKVIQTGLVDQQFSLRLLVTQSQFTTVVNMFLYILQKTW